MSENTRIYQSQSGWQGSSYILDVNGYDWNITTIKARNNNIVSYAYAGSFKKTDAIGFTYNPLSEDNVKLLVGSGIATKNRITEFHYKALALFDKKRENGELPEKKEAKGVKVGQIIFLDAPYENANRDLAVYKIENNIYYYVDIENLSLGQAEYVKPYSKKFGIGYYYKEGKTISQSKLDDLVVDAYAKKAKELKKQQAEQELEKAKTEAQIEEGLQIVKIPTWAKSIIVAELYEDASDTQTDYFNVTITKRIFLAFSKTDRNNMSELKEAAKNFEPTKKMLETLKEGNIDVVEYTRGHSYLPDYFFGTDRWWGWKVKKDKYFLKQKNALNTLAIAASEGRYKVVEQPNKTEKTEVTTEISNLSFRIEQTKHTTKLHNIWVAVADTRVSMEDFKKITLIAKKHGGYYSSFTKNGAIAGFQFKSSEAAMMFSQVFNKSDKSKSLQLAKAKAAALLLLQKQQGLTGLPKPKVYVLNGVKLPEQVIPEISVHYKKSTAKKINFSPDKITQLEQLSSVFYNLFPKKELAYKEFMFVVMFDNKYSPFGYYKHSEGGRAGTVIDLSQIVGVALKCNATAIAIAHNHPSGNLKPSTADIKQSENLSYAAEIVGIKLLDSLIITPQKKSYSIIEKTEV